MMMTDLKEEFDRLSADGFRVLAVAYRDFDPKPAYSKADETGLTLRGYVALLDPPKETASVAIAALRDAGVAVKVLTGDNVLVSRKVCREVGIPTDRVLVAGQVEAMTDAQLAAAAADTTLFARLSPAHKRRVIVALKGAGHVVGFLGDGINDAPALRAADVGVSADNAVDVAMGSADAILLEKDLLVLVGQITRCVLFVGPCSSDFDYAAFFGMLSAVGCRDPPNATLFQTNWFVESLQTQTPIVLIIRTHRVPCVPSRVSRPLFAKSVAVMAVGASLLFSPLGPALGLVPLPILCWPLHAAILSGYVTHAGGEIADAGEGLGDGVWRGGLTPFFGPGRLRVPVTRLLSASRAELGPPAVTATRTPPGQRTPANCAAGRGCTHAGAPPKSPPPPSNSRTLRGSATRPAGGC